MSMGCLVFIFFMPNFLVLRKLEITTKLRENSTNAINPNWAFLLFEHTKIWSNWLVNSLIFGLNLVEVKNEASSALAIMLIFLPLLLRCILSE